MKKTVLRGILATGLAVFAFGAKADTYTTLALPTLNTNIATWTDGAIYNTVFPGTYTWNGVPFALAQDGAGNKAFMGARFAPHDIPVGVYGVTNAYSIINTARGYSGFTVGTIEFYGSSGAYQRFALIEGTNVRDHYWGDWNNTIDGVNAMLAWSVPGHGSHLDMQIYHLSADFSDEILTTMRFTSYGFGNLGTPFIAAATVAATVAVVPEPETWALMLAGLGLMGFTARRRKNRAA